MEIGQSNTGFGHNISGDYVAGDKIEIYTQSKNIEDFIKVAEKILLFLYTEQFDKAQTAINTLSSLVPSSSFSNESKDFVEVLRIYLSILQLQTSDDDISCVKKIINRSKNIELKTFSISLLMQHYVLNDKDKALDIYNKAEMKNSQYINCIYLCNLASYEEIQQYITDKTILDEFECIFIILGLLKFLQNQDKQKDVLDQIVYLLNEISSNFQSFKQVVYTHCRSLLLWIKNNNKTIMYFDKLDYAEIMQLIEGFLPIIQDKVRLTHLEICALHSLIYIVDVNKHNDITQKLFEECQKHVEDMKRVIPNFTENFKCSINYTGEDLHKIDDKLQNLEPLSEKDCDFIFQFSVANELNHSLFSRWLNECCQIQSDIKIKQDFLKLFLQSMDEEFCKNHLAEINQELQTFINEFSLEIGDFSPTYLYALCSRLLYSKLGFENEIKALIEPLLSEDNAQTMLYLVYLYALLNLKQYNLIESHIQRLNNYQLSDEFLCFMIDFYISLDKFAEAQNYCEQLLNSNLNDPNIWYRKISIEISLNESNEQLNQILNDIPQTVFNKDWEEVHRLIVTIAVNINVEFAIKKIVSFFLKDPQKFAPILWQIHFLLLLNNKWKINNDLLFPNVKEGVVYTKDGIEFEQILISDKRGIAEHSDFLDIYSNFGRFISELSVDEEKLYHYQQIKLLRKQPVFPTIMHIAFKMNSKMDISQTGMIPFSVRVDHAQEDIKKIFSRLTVTDPSAQMKNFLSCSDLSIYVKGHLLYNKGRQEIEAALQVLQSTESNRDLHCYYLGGSKCDQLILDIYSFVYLCMSNAYQGLIRSGKKAFITKETEQIIQNWLSLIERGNYSRGGFINNQLALASPEDLQEYYKLFIQSLKKLLEFTVVEQPDICDFPIYIQGLTNVLGASTGSSFELCYANHIPWLCLDPLIVYWLTICEDLQDNQIVDLGFFVNEISQNLTLEEKKPALWQLLNSNLFTVMPTEGEFKELSLSQDEKDRELYDKLIHLNG